MTDDIRIERIDAARFQALAGEAAAVYGAAMDRPPEVVIQRRDIILMHVTYAGFLATGAFSLAADADELVGFGYGYSGAPGQWWHDIVAHAIGRSGTKRWLRDGFELAELHVRPDHQGRGIGRRLLADVLDRANAQHVVLSTPDIESPARGLYRSAGFVDLCVGFTFPGSAEPYAIMGVDL
ncbi:MAG TPA: GNAT family N-acetyltransferase [Mycobacteriales bacterium]|nr:GNAT family N-acetyltransferase [Mycobacteriales bacterium]